MEIFDPIYGQWKVPTELVPLVQSSLAVRARGITMGTVPNPCMPIGPLPSRFGHGLGVMYLAGIVESVNKLSSDEALLMKVAAMMHDWGNPPGAHLFERLLKKLLGFDGETFLQEMLARHKDTEACLRVLGLDSDSVCSMVNGVGKFSKIVHGSMDIDNLDNLARAQFHMRIQGAQFDPVFIAECFRYQFEAGEGWSLQGDHLSGALPRQIELWKAARRKVYNFIYSKPHLVIGAMLLSAGYYALEDGFIDREFFYLNDEQALAYLYKIPSIRCKQLVNDVLQWRWHQQIVSYQTDSPSARLKELSNNWENRILLAEKFARKFKLNPCDVTIFVGSGRMERLIDLPLRENSIVRIGWDSVLPEIYRIQVNVYPAYAQGLSPKGLDFVHEHIT